MQHLDEGTVHAWLDGALPAEQSADVERHVHECAECAALVADARGVIAGAARIVSALDDVPGGVIPKRQAPAATGSLWRSLRLTPFRAAFAASLMVAAASLAVVRRAGQDAPRPAMTQLVRMSPSSVADTQAPAQKLETNVPAKPARPRAPVATAAVPSAPPAREAAQLRSDTGLAKPKSELAMVDSVKASRTGAVAAASPPAEPVARPAAGAAVADMRAKVSDAELRREAPMQPFSLVLASADERPLELPGCYQLLRDSGGPALPLPDRFALENSTDAGAIRNVVRALTRDGRRDSLVAGITWRQAPGANRVLLSNAGLPASSFRQQTVNQIAGGRAAGARVAPGIAGVTPARITRIDCR